MRYDQLEDDIIARLSPLKFKGIEIVPLPERDADIERPFKNARVTVAYKGSVYNDEGTASRPMILSTAEILQKETADVEIIIQSRLLRGEFGVHSVKEQVTKWVTGFMPKNWGRLYSKQYQFLSNDDGLWSYSFTMNTTYWAVQYVDPTNEVLLQKVTIFMNEDPGHIIDITSNMASGETDPDNGVFIFTAGTAFSMEYEFVLNNKPYDLTGYTFRFGIKAFTGDPITLILKSPTATGNIVYGTISSVENTLVPGTYKTVLEVINPSLVVEQEFINTIVIEPNVL